VQGYGDTETFAKEAMGLFYEGRENHGEQQRIEELNDEDFDESIMFWSR
jgi:hypothetical protein